MQKDLRLVMEAVSASSTPLPAAALAHQLFHSNQANGEGREGIQALSKAIRPSLLKGPEPWVFCRGSYFDASSPSLDAMVRSLNGTSLLWKAGSRTMWGWRSWGERWRACLARPTRQS